ncbi:MAG: caspase family protein [Bacteroidota bacterium]
MPQDDNNKKRGFDLNPQNQSHIPIGASWFFGIGINQYDEFPNLNNAVKDVQDICDLLQEEYDVTEETTVLLFDKAATRANILEKLDEVKLKVKAGDKFILYYSGHGHLDRDKLGYWIPTDGKKTSTVNHIRNSAIRETIKVLKSLHTLLISDSCFSGSLFAPGATRTSTSAVEQLEQRISRWAICSGRHDEEVYDGIPGTNSPFCKSIFNALKSNEAYKLNVAKLANEVIEVTGSNYKQLPEGAPLQGVGHDGGQYIFRKKGDKINTPETHKSEATDTKQVEEEIKEVVAINQKHAAVAEEVAALKKAEKKGTISAYNKYLKDYPKGLFVNDAKAKIEAIRTARKKKKEKEQSKTDNPLVSNQFSKLKQPGFTKKPLYKSQSPINPLLKDKLTLSQSEIKARIKQREKNAGISTYSDTGIDFHQLFVKGGVLLYTTVALLLLWTGSSWYESMATYPAYIKWFLTGIGFPGLLFFIIRILLLDFDFDGFFLTALFSAAFGILLILTGIFPVISIPLFTLQIILTSLAGLSTILLLFTELE